MSQKRNNPMKGFTMDPEALVFLEQYAARRRVKMSTALSELLLHIAKKDKVNPVLVKEALSELVQED